MEQALTLELGADGIVVATMNLPGRPMNLVGEALLQGIAAAVERLAQPDARGLVLASGKADFCAGGDLDQIAQWTQAQQAFAASMAMKAVLRRLETQGKPVVAAICGHALGGGLELALACHARVVLDDPRLELGLPEVKLGLLPGGGGTQRLPRLVGMQAALQLMAEGNAIAPAKALALGLVSALAPSRDAVLAQARAWPSPGARPTRRRSSLGTRRGSATPAATRVRRQRCSCWRSRRRSPPPAPGATTRRSRTSRAACSRAGCSASTPPARSRAATSPPA